LSMRGMGSLLGLSMRALAARDGAMIP
jgi:hypothetical protein